MPPNLALLIGAIFVFFAFRYDRRHAVPVSKELWWPTIWYTVVASRMLGVWLATWGIPVPVDFGDATDGSLVDRWFFATLTVIGFWILSRRRFDWAATLRLNPWLTAFLAYMAVSILWSHYPFVSFKRYIKVIGSIVMAMVVLTDGRPMEAFLTVLRRCLYVHLPMSIICVKYFRDIGVSYDWFGTSSSWQGISTSKNVLGQVAMLGALYFFWEVRRRWREYGWRNLHILYLSHGHLSPERLRQCNQPDFGFGLCFCPGGFSLDANFSLPAGRASPRCARGFRRSRCVDSSGAGA